jgi:phosphoglycerol transferase MdoB-like AlkP superfamily enzyme
MKDSWYQKKWQQIPLFILFAIITFIMGAIACSEIVFWNEFSVRFNFIAVDYLIYTNEILENIWESYNMPLILSVLLLLVVLLLFLLRDKILASREVSMRFLKRSVYFLLFLLAPTAHGGVNYTDYAIHKFLSDAAKRPRFDNTFFVIVSDHCSRSAGETDLSVNRYRIPCFIYAPKLIMPLIEQRLTSQIDLAPTY